MKTIVLRPARWAIRHRRGLVLLFFLALVALLGAHPSAHAADVFNNIGPAPQLPPGGWVGRYPVSNYSLDQYFPAISVGLTSGVDASGVAPMIAYFGAQVIWLLTCFLANGVILLFALAFNLNLLTGNGTPGSGALTPVSAAIHNLYTSTFGTPWLIAMVTLVGCWAGWKALVQRRYTETAGALAVSLLCFVLAIGIVTQPEQTIGPASKLSNQLSTALLSLTNEGSVGSEANAKTGASNQLFELLVLNPWTVLQFGGIEHCATVSHGKSHSVAVRPLSADPATDTQLAAQLENGTEVQAEGGKTCINNRNKYAPHFLAYEFQSQSRNSEHEALEHGDDEDLPDSDPGKTSGAYPLGPVDEPAAEAMGKGGQYQRLLLAVVILLGEVGAYLLLGALALGVILAQILLLMLLAFAPVALLIGIFPGRGHEFFRAWLGKLAGYLARKVIYSLILAVVLAVCSALEDATSNLGWLLAFALQVAFLWTVFLQRERLTADLVAGTVGPRAANDGTSRLANLYFATRLARMMPVPHRPRRSSSSTPPETPDGPGGPEPGEGPSPADEGGGTPPPAGGEPSGEGPPPPSTPPGEELPPPPAGAGEPGPHETPTHGPGAPPPTAPDAAAGDPHASAEPAPAEGSPPTPAGAPAPAGEPPARRGAQPAADEQPHEPANARARPGASGPREGSREAPAVAPPAGASTASPSIATPAVVPARDSSPPAGAPSPPPPGVPEPVVPVPAPEPRRESASAAGPLVLHESPRPAAADSGGDASPVAPAIAAEEPVEVLLRARRAATTTDPATQEDDFV